MVVADIAAMKLTVGRSGSSQAGKGGPTFTEIRRQNSRSRSTRRSGGLPAISAALMASIEMPTTQLGYSRFDEALIHAGLVGSKRTAAL
jgi:hypothetical protein